MLSPSAHNRSAFSAIMPQNKMARVRTQVRFSSVGSEIPHQIGKFQRQALYSKQMEALGRPVLKTGERTLTGYQLLELVDELTQSNRWGAIDNLKRMTALGFGALCIGSLGILPLLMSAPTPGQGKPLFSETWQWCENTFRTGANDTQFSASLKDFGNYQALSSKLSDGLKALEQLDLVTRKETDPKDPARCWYLTSRGEEFLRQGHAELAAENGTSHFEIPHFVQLFSQDGPYRVQLLKLLSSNLDSNPVTGWDLLKACNELDPKTDTLPRWCFPGAYQDRLAHDLKLEQDSPVLEARLLQLQELRLVEKTKSGKNAGATQWALTETGRNLAESETLEQAFGLRV